MDLDVEVPDAVGGGGCLGPQLDPVDRLGCRPLDAVPVGEDVPGGVVPAGQGVPVALVLVAVDGAAQGEVAVGGGGDGLFAVGEVGPGPAFGDRLDRDRDDFLGLAAGHGDV